MNLLNGLVLSIDGERMPKHINLNKNPSRSISINHNEVDFSGGFKPILFHMKKFFWVRDLELKIIDQQLK